MAGKCYVLLESPVRRAAPQHILVVANGRIGEGFSDATRMTFEWRGALPGNRGGSQTFAAGAK